MKETLAKSKVIVETKVLTELAKLGTVFFAS